MGAEFSARRGLEEPPARRLILTKPIRELPAETDELIGYEFRRLRVGSGLSADRLASLLGVSSRTLEELERGALSALSDLPRTEKLVSAYGRIAHLDVRPLISRLKAYASATEPRRGAAKPARARSRRGLLRALPLGSMLLAAAGLGVALTLWPEPARQLIEPLTGAISSAMDAGLERVMMAFGGRGG